MLFRSALLTFLCFFHCFSVSIHSVKEQKCRNAMGFLWKDICICCLSNSLVLFLLACLTLNKVYFILNFTNFLNLFLLIVFYVSISKETLFSCISLLFVKYFSLAPPRLKPLTMHIQLSFCL